MKDFLSKEHYRYKFHTFLMKNRAYNPPYMDYPPFLQENLDPSSMIFQKSKPPYRKVGAGGHAMR